MTEFMLEDFTNKRKRFIIILILELGLLAGIMFGCSDYTYAGHIHDKQVTITSIKERGRYIDFKWKKDKSCKAYCVHIECGSKVLYSHCVGKTRNHYKVSVSKSLQKKIDKCSNIKYKVYCSNKAYASGGSGGG